MNLGMMKARARSLSASPTTTRWNDALLTDNANQACLQVGMAVDFPQSTRIFRSNPPPTQPTVTVEGTPGSAQVGYAISAVAVTNGMPIIGSSGGDSAPSPTVSINTSQAPGNLTSVNYNSITFATTPGVTYKVLRQFQATDPFVTLIAVVVAVGASTTVADNGTLVPVDYILGRGNEFQLPDLIKVKRAYIRDQSGDTQPLVPTDIAIMGAEVQQFFDQSSGTIMGNPVYTPQWLAQQAQSFPVQSPIHRQVTVASPWKPTVNGEQVPQYYLRGGYIGVMPPPIGYVQIVVDYIPTPPTLQQNSDMSIYPNGFLDAIAYKMLAYMMMGDDNSRDTDYEARFTEACKALRITYCDTIQGNKPAVIVPTTIRTQMREWSV